MKQIFFLIAVTFTAITATAQTSVIHSSANYEAVAWNTKLLDNPQQILLAPPPTAIGSKAELKTIKDRMANLDNKKIAQIKYWDAGAPSYRWNQIVLALANLKPEVMLRMPAAWMNLAIMMRR